MGNWKKEEEKEEVRRLGAVWVFGFGEDKSRNCIEQALDYFQGHLWNNQTYKVILCWYNVIACYYEWGS